MASMDLVVEEQSMSEEHAVNGMAPVSVPEQKVNCMFCYKNVELYNWEQAKAQRQMMVKTADRLFLYLVNYLELAKEWEDLIRVKSKKYGQCGNLRAGNLPLCVACREMYYKGVYDAFVEYEVAIDRLNEQISRCVTKAIATSSGDGEEQEENNEHEVMKVVKRFRKNVKERKPGGWVGEEDSRKSISCSETEKAMVPSTKTHTKSSGAVAKMGSNDKGSEWDVPASVLEHVKNQMSDSSEDEEDNDSSAEKKSQKPLKYYAVANPLPGVIQIIPMNNPARIGASRSRRAPDERMGSQNSCKFCKKVMPNSVSLIRHMVSEHGMEKPEKCPKCDYRCIEKSYMAKHMETHLEEHERAKHLFQCSECGKEFRSKLSFKNHMDEHSGTRQLYICEVCGKQFNSSDSRRLCMDRHNGVKKFKCSFDGCDKNFLRKEVLKTHLRTHTGEKPFKCDVCGKCFSQRTPLALHCRKIHNK